MLTRITRTLCAFFIVSLSITWQNALFAQTGSPLYPIKLIIKKGSYSGQDLSVLSLQDQTGTEDNWNAYKEFYPAANGFTGIFVFKLPADKNPTEISSLSLSVNYKGPSRSEQRWRWQIRDFVNGKWVLLADNADVPDWEWSLITADVGSTHSNYVNANHKIKIRYLTSSDADNSDIDYLALNTTFGSEPPPPPPPSGNVWQPTPGTTWQWQLQGTIDTSHNVQMYDIDMFDTPQNTIDQLHAQGKTVICYFSAGSWENWRPDADQYPSEIKGRNNGWPGEKWLDVRRIDLLGPVLKARLDLAVSKGCDGVEPDNIDGYSNNTGFPLTYQDQISFNSWIAQEAHIRGLSIGLKNDLEQVEDLVSHFDWALNEQCFEYDECELLLPFIRANKAVFGVEYSGNPAQFCPKANDMHYDWLKKKLDLDAWRLDCKNY